MKLTSKQKRQRLQLIQTIAESNPGLSYGEALEAGCAMFGAIVREAGQQARDPVPAAADLAALSPEQFEEQFEEQFAARLAGTDLSSPFWA